MKALGRNYIIELDGNGDNPLAKGIIKSIGSECKYDLKKGDMVAMSRHASIVIKDNFVLIDEEMIFIKLK